MDSAMKNELIDKKIDDLIEINHLDRRANKESMDRLTGAISELTVAQAENKIYFESMRKDQEDLKITNVGLMNNINSLEKTLAEIKPKIETIDLFDTRLNMSERSYSAIKPHIETIKNNDIKIGALEKDFAAIKPLVDANTKSKDASIARAFSVLEKLVILGLLGGIMYKLNGGG